jgi:hypothetical protein
MQFKKFDNRIDIQFSIPNGNQSSNIISELLRKKDLKNAISLIDNDGTLADDTVFYLLNHGLVEFVMKEYCKLNEDHICYIAYIGDLSTLKYLESIGISLYPCIFNYALHGYLQFSHYYPEQKEHNKYFPLFVYLLSSKKFKFNIMKFAIDYDNINLVKFAVQMKFGRVIDLNYAVKKNNKEIVLLLLNAGIEPTVQTLNLAIKNNNINIVKMLLDTRMITLN